MRLTRNEDGWVFDERHFTNLKEYNGVWVPMTIYYGAKDRPDPFNMKISTVDFTPLEDSFFTLRFPPNTNVHDLVLNESYLIKELDDLLLDDLRKSPIKFNDSNINETSLNNYAQKASEVINQDDEADSNIINNVDPPKKSGFIKWLILIIASVGCTFGILMYKKLF